MEKSSNWRSRYLVFLRFIGGSQMKKCLDVFEGALWDGLAQSGSPGNHSGLKGSRNFGSQTPF